jgi:tetratricopeptide (TPR) repeat protein
VDSPRIQELRRRVQQDRTSLAFAPLAEELRRAGRADEAVRICRAGLEFHPEYVSARATLGRALLALGEREDAFVELTTVLGAAPEHLGALRGVAEIHEQRGEIDAALERYRTALAIARQDPELEQIIARLERTVAAASRVAPRAIPAPAQERHSREAASPKSTPAPPGESDVVRLTMGEWRSSPDDQRRVVLHRLERFLAAIVADRVS